MYSQNEEERYILEATAGIPYGTVLDIGAYDGITRSNSLALIELGWGGVLVEPSPIPFLNLLNLHSTRTDLVHLVHALVGTHSCISSLFLSDDGLSTTEFSNYQIWKGRAEFKPVSFAPMVTIADLIRTFRFAPDVVSIDTEGTSFELFRSFPFNLCVPRVFCVEIDENTADEMIHFAGDVSYKPIYSSYENIVFQREDK